MRTDNNLQKKMQKMQRQVQFLKKSLVKQYMDLESIDSKQVEQQNIQYEIQNIRQKQQNKQNPQNKLPNRTCTNLFMCIMFVILIVVMFIFAVVGWSKPNYTKLTTVYDATGVGCGVKSKENPEYVDYPYAYFVVPEYQTLWRTVCVKKCPKSKTETLLCKPNKYVPSCLPNKSTDSQQSVQIYSSITVWNRFCIPIQNRLRQQIMQTAGQSSLVSKFVSLKRALPIVLASIPFAVVLSILILLCIKLTKQWTIYLLLVLSIAGCIALGIYMLCIPVASKIASNFSKLIGTTFSVFLITFGVILIGGFIGNKNRIKLACTITKSSAAFISDNRIIAVLPFILFILTVGYLILGIFQALSFYSMGTVYRNEHELPFQHFITTWKVKGLLALHIFHVLWVVAFFMETNDFIISGTAANWYYNPKSRKSDLSYQPEGEEKQVQQQNDYYKIFEEDYEQIKKKAQQRMSTVPQPKKITQQRNTQAISKTVTEIQPELTQDVRSNLYTSIQRYLRYHIGSVAFGSFLQVVFGIVKFLYVILTPEESDRLKFNITNDLKKAIDVVCCFCTNYIFHCINSGTYPYIHISGHSYCASSIEVLQLKIREGITAPIITFLGMLFSIIVRVGVTIITVLFCYIFLTTVEPFATEIQDATFFNIIVGAFAFVISSFFGSFYSDSMQAIYVCFLSDKYPKNKFRAMDNRIKFYAEKKLEQEKALIIPPQINNFVEEAGRQMRVQSKKELKNDPTVIAKRNKQMKELNGMKDFVVNSTNLQWYNQKWDQAIKDQEQKEKQKEKQKENQKQKQSAMKNQSQKKQQNKQAGTQEKKVSRRPSKPRVVQV